MFSSYIILIEAFAHCKLHPAVDEHDELPGAEACHCLGAANHTLQVGDYAVKTPAQEYDQFRSRAGERGPEDWRTTRRL